MDDTYTTITDTAEGYYTDRRSKFFAFAHHVTSADEVRSLQDHYRRAYHDARHICYAYRLGPDGGMSRANDDGEPSNTAGKPILSSILRCSLTDIVIFVVRYYGGVNLGTNGLVNAYRTAAQDALNNATTVERHVEEVITLSFEYAQMNNIMRVVKDLNARIISLDYQNTCTISLAIRKTLITQLRERVKGISDEAS